jgi:hypothetical protein
VSRGFLSFFLGYPAWIERFYAPLEERRWTRSSAGEKRPRRVASRPMVPLPVIVDRFEPALTSWFAFAASDEEAFKILGQYLRVGNRLLPEEQLLYLARVIERCGTKSGAWADCRRGR